MKRLDLRSFFYPVALADKAGVVLLPDGDRAGAALLVYDGRGHHHVQVARH